MRKTAVLTLLAAALVFGPGAQPAGACTCLVRDRAAQIEAAQVVFTGVAHRVRDVAPDRLAATFDVTAVFKGAAPRRVSIATASQPEACGTPFREGKAYAVFATGSALSLTTGLCSGTTDDVTVLAGLTSRPPSALGATAPRFSPAQSRTLAIAVAALLLGLTVAATAATRRFRARPRRLA